MSRVVEVSNAVDLVGALSTTPPPEKVIVTGTIPGLPSLTLPVGTALEGGRLEFTGRGLRLTANNLLKDTTLIAAPEEIAVRNDTRRSSAGTLRFENVTASGQVLLLAHDRLSDLRVEVDGLAIESADVRAREMRPRGYGVEALQGAFTLWNRQADPAVVVTATIEGLSVGAEGSPARGSGVFIAGYASGEGETPGGVVDIDTLATGAIFTDGGIRPGTPDLISAGVFVLGGAHVIDVLTRGPVLTSGPNDMVLDLWGNAERWTVTAPISSTGPSGIGVVVFGELDELRVDAPIETSGLGARGFNLYDGRIGRAFFDSITTHGDGAIGIQLSKAMGPIDVSGDLRTTGGVGMSLVKGVQIELRASAISLKPGADTPSLHVRGRVLTEGEDLSAVEVLEGARVGELRLDSGIEAKGVGSRATLLSGEVASLNLPLD